MKKKVFVVLTAILLTITCFCGVDFIDSFAKDSIEILNGHTYDLGEKDAYDINVAVETSDDASRLRVLGDISAITNDGDITKYAVGSGNLKIIINKPFSDKLMSTDNPKEWHIIKDTTKVVDGTKLQEAINTGAIVIQTSKDGKAWVNAFSTTDIHNKLDSLNNRIVNGEETGCLYETTNVQITNGCYYRIIVAYKLEREKDGKQEFLKSNKEQKERIEIYKFYAFDPSVNTTEKLDTKDAYEFGDVYRVDSSNGFQNPVLIKSDDPHIDWSVGHFYVSGYTDVRKDEDIPVFLKVPGDRASLWFNLEQEIDKCNGQADVKVDYISAGSDLYFGTPTINDFGRGALIIRKTDKQNQKERQIYTNYLEASATVGANTRVDLFEEGDYEVALDYQLHYDKPFVFGTTTTKTLAYRIFFKFKVRNGDISLFLRDVDSNQFISNASIAPHGFYIDVANSQYLNISIKREILSDSLDGLIEDTKFAGVAKEGRRYTEEGVYTVTVDNPATGGSLEKKVYVGDRDIMRAHMTTGISLAEINERMAAGAFIDEEGNIIDPEEKDEFIQVDSEKIVKEDEDGIVPKSLDKSIDEEKNAGDKSMPDVAKAASPKRKSSAMIVVASVLVVVLAGTIIGVLNKEKIIEVISGNSKGEK